MVMKHYIHIPGPLGLPSNLTSFSVHGFTLVVILSSS